MFEQIYMFDEVPKLVIVPPKVKVEFQKVCSDLYREFERWNTLLNTGGFDPFWPDGSNMNLVRNHIIYDKRSLKEFNETYGLELPEIYFKETPEEVDNEYQAPGTKSGRYYIFKKAYQLAIEDF